MASVNAIFGRTVRALRSAAGYSQEGFADAIHVHRTYMGTIERGEGNPTLDMIARMAHGLNLSLSQLFEALETGQPDIAADITSPQSTKAHRIAQRPGTARLPRTGDRPRRGSKGDE
jgi:transcriptional regulator with XRE-family HTH domain